MNTLIPGLLALISAITTSILLSASGWSSALFASLLTALFTALSLFLRPKTALVTQQPSSSSPSAERPVAAQVPPAPSDSEEAAVLLFLRQLQEKGRLLDFALTDIARLPDAQVGAAARIVHQGLRSVLNDSFDIKPIAAEAEGQKLQLPEDFDSSRYRLLQQQASSKAPAGILLHRGWEVGGIHLPRSTRRPGEPLPKVLAPAEIEAREFPL